MRTAFFCLSNSSDIPTRIIDYIWAAVTILNQKQNSLLGFVPMKIVQYALLIVFLFLAKASFTQGIDTSKVDSLIMRLSVLDQGIEKADVLYTISETYGKQDCERSEEYAQYSLNLCKQIKYKYGEARALNRLGEVFLMCDNNVIESLAKYNEAMRIANQISATGLQYEILSNLAYNAYANEDLESAKDHYEKIIDIAARNNDLNELSNAYSYLGYAYLGAGDTANAIINFEKVIDFQGDQLSKIESTNVLSTIAEYYLIKNDFDNAKKFARKSILAAKKDADPAWLAYNNYFLGVIHFKADSIYKARYYGEVAKKIAEKYSLNKERVDSYGLLTEVYDQIGAHEMALDNLQRLNSLQDSIREVEANSREQAIQSEFQTFKAEQENQRTKSELREKELAYENDQLIIRFIIAILVVTFVFLFFIYRRLRKGTKLNKQLNEQRQQLEKLSIVAANIDQMVMIVGNDDRIEWVNEAFERTFGFLRFEAVNRTPMELLGGKETNLEDVQMINERIFKEKRSFEQKLVQYAKDGRAYLTRLHINPILNENDRLERYVIISHDITEEQKVAEELKELSLVASNTTNSIAIFDQNMQVIWVNDGFSLVSGMSGDAAQGKNPVEIYNGPILSAREKEKLLDKYRSQEPFTIDFESVNRRSDKRYWLSMSVTPVFDENDRLIKYISVATDITDLKILEEQYEGLVESSSDIIFEIKDSGHFVFINDVMAKTFGYDKEEMIGAHFSKFVFEDDRDMVIRNYEDQIANKQSESYIEFRVKNSDGKHIWLGQRAKAKWDENHEKITGFNVIASDITDQKQVSQRLDQTCQNTRLMSEIGMQITATRTVIEIINNVYDNINKLMDANIFGIGIPNKEGNSLDFPIVLEKGETFENVSYSLDDDNRIAVVSFKEEEPIVMNNFEEDFKFYFPEQEVVAPKAGEMARSLIYFPLRSKGNTIGVITVQSFNVNAYEEYQVDLIRSLASFVAIAIENATLYETMEDEINKRTAEVRVQKEELEVNYYNTRLLSEIGQLVSSTLNFGSILDELYEKVGQLMDAEIFAVRIFDEGTQQIHFTYTIENGKRCEPFSISMEEEHNYNVWCIKHQKEILINDHQKDYKKYVSEIQVLQGDLPESLIFYPMIVEENLIGVITIQSFNKNAYQSYHLDILKTLASYIGTVISNAALYNTLETKVEERTMELAEKNADITASINYAKRLQKGILPDASFMHQLLPDSFVYYRPKDIVSGDFYWVDRNHAKVFFAVVDCTGHGVPGAMMSIIGRNLLDQAVNEKGLATPSQILNFLQVGLSLAFGQTAEKKAALFDGMDLALCAIDVKENILEFAGANSSLYLIQDDELVVLKGDKVGISAEYEVTNMYNNIEIEVGKGDMIYLTSDGYPDQFGGERYKKYTYRRMNQLFEEIYKLPIEEQKARIEKAFLDWKDDKEQTDDVCLMGIRL